MIYNVHIYREMRLKFDGIEAATPEAAAEIARDKPTDQADEIDDCEGVTMAALVDEAGDDEYERSVTIDFECERERKTAAAMLTAIRAFIEADQMAEQCGEWKWENLDRAGSNRNRQCGRTGGPFAPEGIMTDTDVQTPLLIPKGRPLVSGKMYLRLYHGRTDPGQKMDDWGFVGPTFGPLSIYVHTYCSAFRIHGECDTSELWLEKHDDMIRWSGCFYGDMEVFIAVANDKA